MRRGPWAWGEFTKLGLMRLKPPVGGLDQNRGLGLERIAVKPLIALNSHGSRRQPLLAVEWRNRA